jgi:hypothetical protein
MIAQIGAADSWLAAWRLAPLKAGGNHGYPNLVPERVIDDGTEDDVRLFMRRPLDQVGSSRNLEQAEVRATGDRKQDAVGTVDAGL